MSHSLLVLVLGALAVIAAGVPAWARYAPTSFWFGFGFPIKAARVRFTWAHVAASCGLASQRVRWRWTLDAVPVAGTLKRTSVLLTPGRRMRRIAVPHAPGLGLLRPNRMGWTVRIRLLEGQVPADYSRAAEQLAHAWRVHAVRVTATAPGRVWLLATRTDPLTHIEMTPEASELLTVEVGMLETGHPWVIDFRTVPHWPNAGATQSGKSNLANAIITGLAPQPVALVGFDLKGGVEFTPYRPRLSALATTRTESCRLLENLGQLVAGRMDLCRHYGARDIWRLPEPIRPVPVVVLVDEVAELFLIADKTEKEQVTRIGTGLLRLAQLGRAFGVYLIICGQRIGSDLGPGVTALRAQLSGRICHRVNDPETATMTLGDLDPAALDAARIIPATTPGVAIVAGQDGTWHRARSALVTDAAAFLIAVSMLERRTPARTPASPVLAASSSPAIRTVPSQDDRPVPVPPAQPGPAGPLVDYARKIAADHQAATGQPITRDALRARLGISNQLASELLRQLRATPGTQ